MFIPLGLKYTRNHYWVRLAGNRAVVGLTEQALAEMGMILYMELPVTGSVLRQGEFWGSAETASEEHDLFAPLSGKIAEVNIWIDKTTMPLYESPYDKGWLFAIEWSSEEELSALWTAEAYLLEYPQEQE